MDGENGGHHPDPLRAASGVYNIPFGFMVTQQIKDELDELLDESHRQCEWRLRENRARAEKSAERSFARKERLAANEKKRAAKKAARARALRDRESIIISMRQTRSCSRAYR